jgi:hypothetical protein
VFDQHVEVLKKIVAEDATNVATDDRKREEWEVSKQMATKCFYEAGWTTRAAHLPVFPALAPAFFGAKAYLALPSTSGSVESWGAWVENGDSG